MATPPKKPRTLKIVKGNEVSEVEMTTPSPLAGTAKKPRKTTKTPKASTRDLEIVYGDGKVSRLPMLTPSPLGRKSRPKATPVSQEELVEKPEKSSPQKKVKTEVGENGMVRRERRAAPRPEPTPQPAAKPAASSTPRTVVEKLSVVLGPNLERIQKNTRETSALMYGVQKSTKDMSRALDTVVENQRDLLKSNAELTKTVKENLGGGSGGIADFVASAVMGGLAKHAGTAAVAAGAAGAAGLAGKALSGGSNVPNAPAPQQPAPNNSKPNTPAPKPNTPPTPPKPVAPPPKPVPGQAGKAAANVGKAAAGKAVAKTVTKVAGTAIGSVIAGIFGTPAAGAAAAIALPIAIEAGFDYLFSDDEAAKNAEKAAEKQTPPSPPSAPTSPAKLSPEEEEKRRKAAEEKAFNDRLWEQEIKKTRDSIYGKGDQPGKPNGPVPGASTPVSPLGGIEHILGGGSGKDALAGGAGNDTLLGGGEITRAQKLDQMREDRVAELEQLVKLKDEETNRQFQALNGESSSEDSRAAMESQAALEALKEELQAAKNAKNNLFESPKESEELNRIFGKPLLTQTEVITKGMLDNSGKPYLERITDAIEGLFAFAVGGTPGSTGAGAGGGGGGGGAAPGLPGGGFGKPGAGGSVPNVAPAAKGLGSLSAQYESSKAGSSAIGNDSTGGFSYGKYQFSTKRGSMANFMEDLKTANPEAYAKLQAAGGIQGATAGTPEFKKAWQEVSKMEGFGDAEHASIQKRLYDPAVQKIAKNTGLDVNSRSKTLQDVAWSTAVQHGDTGAKDVFSAAQKKLGKPLSEASDEEITNALYDVRGNFFSKSTDKERAAVQARFVKEKQNALASLQQERANPASTLVAEGQTAGQPALKPSDNPALPPVPQQSASEVSAASQAASPTIVNASSPTVINSGGGNSTPPVRLSSRNDDTTVERLQAQYLYHGVVY